MLCCHSAEYTTRSYKSYKAEKFEKNKQKVLQILKGISDTSLKDEDKKKLVLEIKKIVAHF